MSDLIAVAEGAGFHKACYFDPQKLNFDDADILRDACRANDCGMYGKYWTCPPGVGTPEECSKHLLRYHHGIVMQFLTEPVSCSLNPDLFNEISRSINEMTRAVRDVLEEITDDIMMLGMSACSLCKECTYLDGKKCRFPHDMVACISGHCVNVYRLWDSTGNRRANLDETDFYTMLLWNGPSDKQ